MEEDTNDLNEYIRMQSYDISGFSDRNPEWRHLICSTYITSNPHRELRTVTLDLQTGGLNYDVYKSILVSLKDYFNDFYNPTDNELRVFEMMTGEKLPWARLNKPTSS